MVDDVINWGTANGTSLVERSNDVDNDGNLYETVTTDDHGDLTVAVWTPRLTPGDYDVVADYGCDGDYKLPRDMVSTDSRDVAGFTVVPESAIAIAAIALLVPGMIYVVRRKKK